MAYFPSWLARNAYDCTVNASIMSGPPTSGKRSKKRFRGGRAYPRVERERSTKNAPYLVLSAHTIAIADVQRKLFVDWRLYVGIAGNIYPHQKVHLYEIKWHGNRSAPYAVYCGIATRDIGKSASGSSCGLATCLLGPTCPLRIVRRDGLMWVGGVTCLGCTY